MHLKDGEKSRHVLFTTKNPHHFAFPPSIAPFWFFSPPIGAMAGRGGGWQRVWKYVFSKKNTGNSGVPKYMFIYMCVYIYNYVFWNIFCITGVPNMFFSIPEIMNRIIYIL